MREMKDSGVEWIGKIPKDWEIVPLTKQLDSIVDYRGKTPEKTEEGTFLVTAKNIKDGKIILRLFNAEGDRKQHNITFDMPLSSIEEVDLNGRIIDRKTIKTRTGKSEISISMPRFGLKTFALNLN